MDAAEELLGSGEGCLFPFGVKVRVKRKSSGVIGPPTSGTRFLAVFLQSGPECVATVGGT